MRRAWGHINRWLVNAGDETWDLIGTAGFEDRSIACLQQTSQSLSRAFFLRLEPASLRRKGLIQEKIRNNSAAINAAFPATEYFDAELLDPPNDFIETLDKWLSKPVSRVLVDMSAMPKRYLAVLLKRLIEESKARDILVTYTIPEKYTTEPLTEDQAPFTTLPGFLKEEIIDVPIRNIIIGLGYMQFDLNSVIDSIETPHDVNILFPFPPGAPSFQRNWKMLLDLFGTGEDFPEPIRIDSRDVSYAYDVIDDLTGRGSETSILLPFGPKPHSLAMILHSIYRRSEVRYTQPNFYHPEYSTGIKTLGGRSEVYAYAVRLNGKDLFA